MGPTGPGTAPTRTCTEVEPIANRGDFKVQTAKDGFKYWVRLPKGYDRKNPKPTKTIIGLHGCGDPAKNFITWGIVPWETLETSEHIGITVETAGEPGCWQGSDTPRVRAVLDDAAQCYFLDQQKIILAGYSSGGMTAYRLALTESDRYAGFLAYKTSLSATGEADKLIAGAKRKIPIVHLAGTSDGSFPIAVVRGDRDKLKNAGFPIELIEVAGGHNGESPEWKDKLLPKATWSF